MKYKTADDIRVLPGVGPKTSENFTRLGIFKIGDLLKWYPRNYLDASHPQTIQSAPRGELVAIKGLVCEVEVKKSHSKMDMLDVTISDQSGKLLVRYFNQNFLLKKLKVGSEWIFIGKVDNFFGKLTMLSPLIEENPKILAIYGQTKGLTSKMLRYYISEVLNNLASEGLEWWPDELRKEAGIDYWKEALTYLHQPLNMDFVKLGRARASFDETGDFFLQMLIEKRMFDRGGGIKISYDLPFLQQIVSSLPFTLTNSQKQAVWMMVQELSSGRSMARLLNGDVGSGKTIVAGILATLVAKAGYQSILLVPTEVLAQQHGETLANLFSKFGLIVRHYTRTQKEEISDAGLIVGTHAVLQADFQPPRLAFIIIDEQHRFGVSQRQALLSRSSLNPHLLSMSATPIPRTLALVLYGNLEVTFLKEKPANRKPVITRIVRNEQRVKMYEQIESEINKGKQVFVICPLIEGKKASENEEGPLVLWMDEAQNMEQERKTVKLEKERLQKEFPHFGVIEAIHGQMKATDKQAVMQRMVKGEIKVLVATSIIEVGLDIPNATVMVIEEAERFGLAQLHQFRGRIGRSEEQGYCYLCPAKLTPWSQQRLEVLVQENDGFKIAEADLSQRGPGELGGEAQSGLPDFRMTSLTDIEYLERIKNIIFQYCEKHPDFLAKYALKFSSHSSAKLTL
jgi:ATP-dependent DNA helicase RecG